MTNVKSLIWAAALTHCIGDFVTLAIPSATLSNWISRRWPPASVIWSNGIRTCWRRSMAKVSHFIWKWVRVGSHRIILIRRRWSSFQSNGPAFGKLSHHGSRFAESRRSREQIEASWSGLYVANHFPGGMCFGVHRTGQLSASVEMVWWALYFGCFHQLRASESLINPQLAMDIDRNISF